MADHAAMACPVCRTALMMSERQGIEIDYCPACRGIWLDRGEMDKIIERSGAEPAAAPVSRPPSRDTRRYDDDHRHHSHGRPRKSFLAELFD